MEVIVGITQDPQFGPIIMFGIGGVLVEVYRDVAMRACPVTPMEAREMIAEVKGAPLLRGFRGAAPSDVDALAEVLVSISRMAIDLGRSQAGTRRQPADGVARRPGVKAVDALLTLS